MRSVTFAVIAALSTATSVLAADKKGVPVPSQLPKAGARRSQGCYLAKGDTWELTPSTLDFPASGSCLDYCQPLNFTVAGLQAEDCYCGYDYPPKDTSTDDSDCSYPCPGYDLEACGNIDPTAFSVWNSGVKAKVPYAEDPSSSTTATSTSKATATADPEKTSTDSAVPATSTEESGSEDGSKGSTVGIAVGVVVGVLLFAAAIGGGFFYMRRQKRMEEAEERRRADAVSAFTTGGSKPGSINGSFADSRLDPVMAHRRMSDGSIADNEDYSRKILRVTNA